MFGDGNRIVANPKTGLLYAGAEIDILEPDGKETLVEAAQPFPYRPAEHQEGAGRLFDEGRSHRVKS
jgi:hypothetical protein